MGCRLWVPTIEHSNPPRTHLEPPAPLSVDIASIPGPSARSTDGRGASAISAEHEASAMMTEREASTADMASEEIPASRNGR